MVKGQQLAPGLNQCPMCGEIYPHDNGYGHFVMHEKGAGIKQTEQELIKRGLERERLSETTDLEA